MRRNACELAIYASWRFFFAIEFWTPYRMLWGLFFCVFFSMLVMWVMVWDNVDGLIERFFYTLRGDECLGDGTRYMQKYIFFLNWSRCHNQCCHVLEWFFTFFFISLALLLLVYHIHDKHAKIWSVFLNALIYYQSKLFFNACYAIVFSWTHYCIEHNGLQMKKSGFVDFGCNGMKPVVSFFDKKKYRSKSDWKNIENRTNQ